MEKNEPIGTGAAIRELTLAPGVSVKVRRASKGVQNRIVREAALKGADDVAGMLTIQELLTRWGLTDARGLKCFASETPLTYSHEAHPTLGAMATLDVYDAVAEIDGALEQIDAYIQSGALSEADRGN